MGPIKLEVLFNGDIQVLVDYPFFLNGKRFVIPKGFRTDFGTIPFGFRNLIPKIGKHSFACVVHDYLCVIGHNKKETDLFFLELMEGAGVSLWKRRMMYRGVRLYSPLRKGD